MSSKPGPDMKEPTHQQVLQFVRQNSKPFVTTSDVSDRFSGVSSKTVRERLKTLEEQSELNMRRVGANSKVWFIPPDQESSSDTDAESRSFPRSDNQ